MTDVDGIAYDDFCLGDTPSMFGHARAELAAAVADQAGQGVGYMLPMPLSNVVGDLLCERFGMDQWQVATTASDANRAVIRWARAITGRERILVFDGCYHGMVEDCFVALYDGVPSNKTGLIGQVHDQTQTTTVIAFNDLAALEAALATGNIAAVLAEPVMTNCGMIRPDDGFLQALRDLCTAHGTLLVMDETHTLSSDPRGYCVAHGLKPDMFVVGKAIAGGIPAAVWGVTAEVAARMDEAQARIGPGQSGIGTTLSGNALVMRAIHTVLTQIATQPAYDHMLAGAEYLVAGLDRVIAGLPWCTVHVGARVELVFAPEPPRNAEEMRRYLDHDLLDAFHLFLINRGVLIAPFHNMMLISPQTQTQAIDRLVDAVAAFAHHYREFS
ncbi:aminotransferase [Asticcacaulis sp. AC460]|nr:aminotransferase [Asticcacaulis sp. AC460]